MSHRTLFSALLALVTLFPVLTQAEVEKLSEADLQKYQSQLPDAINAAKGPPLRSHLERLQKQKATPEGRLAIVNAVRVAQDVKELQFRGQVVHYAVDPMSELQRLPDAYPLDGRAMHRVTIIAAQDEFEPCSFVLYPLANLGKARLELGEFRPADGKVFPEEDLDSEGHQGLVPERQRLVQLLRGYGTQAHAGASPQ